MKSSVLKIFSAFLLMAIAVTVSLGAITAVKGEKATQEQQTADFVWIRLPFRTAPGNEIRLYSEKGQPMGSFQADSEGKAISGPLPVGTYYAVTEELCCPFSLTAQAQVILLGGCGEFDGQTLHLTGENMGSVTLTFQAEEEGREFCLTDGADHAYRIFPESSSQVVSCVFSAIPYGSYRLEEDGIYLCSLTLSAHSPHVTVSLP